MLEDDQADRNMWHVLLGLIKFVVLEGKHLSFLNITYHIEINSTKKKCELSRLLNNALIYVLILIVLVYMLIHFFLGHTHLYSGLLYISLW